MAHVGIHHDAAAGLLPKAASLVAKYAERDDEGNIRYTTAAIENIGVHPGNRGGVYTQGQRCRSLFQTLMQAGFSKEDLCGHCGSRCGTKSASVHLLFLVCLFK